jgi:hypothetical protein
VSLKDIFQNYLMAEAVRLMRQAPPQLDQDSIERLWGIRTRKDIQKCLHSKPVSEELFKLGDISP